MADALRCEPARVAPLAQLVHDKTAGNPFFAMQFMAALADEGLLTFDHGQGCWSWDLDRIHAKGYTDNVVDLMVGKLHRLPVETQEALQQLACLGNTAAISTLALVRGTSEEAVHARSVGGGPSRGDRAAGGRLQVYPRPRPGSRLFPDPGGRTRRSASPHRAAARSAYASRGAGRGDLRARQSAQPWRRADHLHKRNASSWQNSTSWPARAPRHATAYASALTYLLAGAALLAEDCWERQHALAFSLEFHRAECEFLTGALAAAEERLTALATRAATTVEHATVSCLRMDVYTTLGQSGRAIAVGLDYLRRVGIDWSPHPTEEDVRREYERIWAQLGGRTVEELIELPLMSDPVALATLDVLTRLVPPAMHYGCEPRGPGHLPRRSISASSVATATGRASPMPCLAGSLARISATTRPDCASASSATN